MGLTKEDLDVLKALVQSELEKIKEDGENFKIVNSPVLSMVARFREQDIEFLKTETLYIKFLEKLLKKL